MYIIPICIIMTIIIFDNITTIHYTSFKCIMQHMLYSFSIFKVLNGDVVPSIYGPVAAI